MEPGRRSDPSDRRARRKARICKEYGLTAEAVNLVTALFRECPVKADNPREILINPEKSL